MFAVMIRGPKQRAFEVRLAGLSGRQNGEAFSICELRLTIAPPLIQVRALPAYGCSTDKDTRRIFDLRVTIGHKCGMRAPLCAAVAGAARRLNERPFRANGRNSEGNRTNMSRAGYVPRGEARRGGRLVLDYELAGHRQAGCFQSNQVDAGTQSANVEVEQDSRTGPG